MNPRDVDFVVLVGVVLVVIAAVVLFYVLGFSQIHVG